jgi:enolase-phosphatase E1
LPGVLDSQWDSSEFAKYRDAFPPEFAASKDAFTQHVSDLMSQDVKAPYLKSLQGYLWESGYKAGQLKAPLFPEVAPKLAAWKKQGVQIMIYSSGSVPAQKLLFAHTDAEPSDLTPIISDYFDTVNAGPKTETASYQKIAAKYPQITASAWLFVSDNVKEVEAAKQAGMQSFVVERPGNAPLSDEARKTHKVAMSFDEL